ncbi:hypothetical protein PCE31106_03496 [Pandoraea cepalis]|uniref:Uncharacterized protein n=1 Tax=Pandoraea cepalis TaxID=2508294 RepID=A0A5E4WYK8_9BURK|nr:hypothetical protein [Pandoraea cepalis]VVE28166.1 hypothetical protein PCE31106_03496 [Pandoraea cepalis]
MTSGSISGNRLGPSPARWSRLDHARNIGLHSFALHRLPMGALFLFPSRGEHAGTY